MPEVFEKEELRERIALLMRLFWLDIIFKLGKQLAIPYFNQFSNYWEINHYQAALEVAKSVNDEQLLKLANQNPPRYGISMGGFQGNYYIANEKGIVRLGSAWPSVQQNIKKALQKWQLSAYGALQAVLNLGGETTYWQLLEEAEKLGARISPYLLRRLEALKLIFKTGSRRYPTWTIPPEIIPLLKEELNKFPIPERAAGTVEITPPTTRESVLIQAEEYYTALKEVENILSRAKRYIKIIDPWLGEEALDFFWKSPREIAIQILTKTIVDSERFELAYHRLIRERRGNLKIRKSKSTELHDRYILTADELWLLGPSFKDLGKKLGTITKIDDVDIRGRIEEFFDSEWEVSQPI